MLIAVLISLLIQANEAENVTRTVTYYKSDNDDFYRRFISTVYSRNLNKFDFIDDNNGNKYYVLRADKPLDFEKYSYYWNETHDDLKEFHHICEYRFSYFDAIEKLGGKTYFPNKTRPEAIFYHCSFPYSCFGLECKMENRIIVSFGFVVFLGLTLYFVRKFIWRDLKRMEIERRAEQQAINLNIRRAEHIVSVAFSEQKESPPPSYNMLFSTSPPSYESVVRDKVTYTVPSFSPVT